MLIAVFSSRAADPESFSRNYRPFLFYSFPYPLSTQIFFLRPPCLSIPLSLHFCKGKRRNVNSWYAKPCFLQRETLCQNSSSVWSELLLFKNRGDPQPYCWLAMNKSKKGKRKRERERERERERAKNRSPRRGM